MRETRERQVALWKDFILDYCRNNRVRRRRKHSDVPHVHASVCGAGVHGVCGGGHGAGVQHSHQPCVGLRYHVRVRVPGISRLRQASLAWRLVASS